MTRSAAPSPRAVFGLGPEAPRRAHLFQNGTAESEQSPSPFLIRSPVTPSAGKNTQKKQSQEASTVCQDERKSKAAQLEGQRGRTRRSPETRTGSAKLRRLKILGIVRKKKARRSKLSLAAFFFCQRQTPSPRGNRPLPRSV